jgi:hypothetical protein
LGTTECILRHYWCSSSIVFFYYEVYCIHRMARHDELHKVYVEILQLVLLRWGIRQVANLEYEMKD